MLNYSAEQFEAINSSDSGFYEEAAELSLEFIGERRQLALLLDSQSTDELILSQAEKVIYTNNALINRVVAHVLVIRKHLTEEQQELLISLCNDVIHGRAAKGRLQSESSTNNDNRNFDPGKEKVMGLGRRNGEGCLSQNIIFTPEQIPIIDQLDPDFEIKTAALRDLASKEYSHFYLLLTQTNSSDEVIRVQLEILLEIRIKLERRIVQHIIRIRSILSPKQQKNLAGLCGSCRGSQGIGKRELKDLCAEYNLDVTTVLQTLRRENIHAQAEMSIKTIAEKNQMSPVDVYMIIRKNSNKSKPN